MFKLRRLAPAVLIVATVGACTPNEVSWWAEWWESDPQAAEDYAHQDWVQESLRNQCAGPCDDSSAEVTPEDVRNGSDHPSDEGQDSAGVYEPWISLAECESGGNWSIDTGNGYYGGLQFAWGSWEAAGGSGNPAHASPSEQVHRGEILQDMQGWGAWPTCARQIGLL